MELILKVLFKCNVIWNVILYLKGQSIFNITAKAKRHIFIYGSLKIMVLWFQKGVVQYMETIINMSR